MSKQGKDTFFVSVPVNARVVVDVDALGEAAGVAVARVKAIIASAPELSMLFEVARTEPVIMALEPTGVAAAKKAPAKEEKPAPASKPVKKAPVETEADEEDDEDEADEDEDEDEDEKPAKAVKASKKPAADADDDEADEDDEDEDEADEDDEDEADEEEGEKPVKASKPAMKIKKPGKK